MKNHFLLLIVLFFAFSSCVKYEGEKKVYPEKEYLVASERGCFRGEYDGWIPYYFVKEKGSAKWETYEYIEGFEYVPGQEKQPDNYYVPGHEYRIIANKVEDPALLKIADGPSPTYLRLVKILSDEEKTTEGLPEHYIPDSEE